MSGYMKIEPMDLVVYGQVQNAFVCSDAPTVRLSYAEAVVKAALKRATSVQNELVPLMEAIRQRSAKLEQLGASLAAVSEVLMAFQTGDEKPSMTSKETKSLGTVRVGGATRYVADILNSYGITVTDNDGNVKSVPYSVTYAEVMKLQQNVKLELDKENTQVSQDNSSASSFNDKCASAFNTIGKLQDKIDKTIGRTIGQIGQ